LDHPRKEKIALLPLGPLSQEHLVLLREELTRAFSKQVDFLRTIDVPEQSFNPTRKQFHSTTILKNLHRTLGGRYERILALTRVDLFVPQLNFVFGEADVINGNAILSLARLRPEFYGLKADDDLLRERIVKESIHEIGHTYNMTHCENPECVMYFSNNIRETDAKTKVFCKECQKMLEEHMAPVA
jgi:archaemetzincin